MIYGKRVGLYDRRKPSDALIAHVAELERTEANLKRELSEMHTSLENMHTRAERAEAELAALKHDLERLVQTNTDLATEVVRFRDAKMPDGVDTIRAWLATTANHGSIPFYEDGTPTPNRIGLLAAIHTLEELRTYAAAQVVRADDAENLCVRVEDITEKARPFYNELKQHIAALESVLKEAEEHHNREELSAAESLNPEVACYADYHANRAAYFSAKLEEE
jgi:DNA repair exonuclease SbcCD ATPase subunit